jgi:hypothetical protein
MASLLGIETASSPMSDSDYPACGVAILVGTAILPSLVYGINATLIFLILRLLWKGQTADTRKRTHLMTTYLALLCTLCTAHWVLSCVVEALSLVGITLPSKEIVSMVPQLVIILAFDSIYLTLTCMTDGLLVRVDSNPTCSSRPETKS